MILQSLVALAQREGVVDSPWLEVRELHWRITVSSDGGMLSFESLLRPATAAGKRTTGIKVQIPRQSGRTSRDQAELFVDKAEYVLGMGTSPEEKLRRRQSLFRRAVEEAFNATGDPGVDAVRRFLSSAALDRARREAVTWCGRKDGLLANHLIGFRLAGDSEWFCQRNLAPQ